MYVNVKTLVVTAVLVICGIGISSTLFQKCSNPNKSLKNIVDSLHKVNNLLQKTIDSNKVYILAQVKQDSILKIKYEKEKEKIGVEIRYVDSSKRRVDTLKDPELIKLFNDRYPRDTVTRKLQLAHPVLIETAKDLIELDGARKIIPIKDSLLLLDSNRLALKDTSIAKYRLNETLYLRKIYNKDFEISNWATQYDKLYRDSRKFKAKTKLFKIGSYVLIGGLTYALLTK